MYFYVFYQLKGEDVSSVIRLEEERTVVYVWVCVHTALFVLAKHRPHVEMAAPWVCGINTLHLYLYFLNFWRSTILRTKYSAALQCSSLMLI